MTAGVLVLALIVGVGITTFGATEHVRPDALGDGSADLPDRGIVTLVATTASPVLNDAIRELAAAERFRFELKMSSSGATSEGAWKIIGLADIATGPDDPARVQATVGVGRQGAFTVLSDQIRIGDRVFSRKPGAATYSAEASAGPGLTRSGPVDPVSSVLANVQGLGPSAFDTESRGSTTVITIETGPRSSMIVRIDAATRSIRRIDMVTRKVTSVLSLMDIGDPSIAIDAPAT